MRVLVVTGGNSDEKEISLLSAKNVTPALKERKYEVVEFDFKNGFGELQKLLKDGDIVFPVLHGFEGEGGVLQKWLEAKKIKFVGSGSNACELTWDKAPFKELCKQKGILTALWIVIDSSGIDILKEKIPFVLKPKDSGSSVDVYLVRSEKELSRIDFEALFKKYDKLLIEDLIEGVEVTVGVLDKEALPVIEIRPPEKEWFSYENKYNGKTQEIPFAPSLSEKQQKEAQEISLQVHREFGCRHFSRTDLMQAEDGTFYVLELNTVPGLTSESLFPKAAAAAGISFEELLDRLVKMAAKD